MRGHGSVSDQLRRLDYSRQPRRNHPSKRGGKMTRKKPRSPCNRTRKTTSNHSVCSPRRRNRKPNRPGQRLKPSDYTGSSRPSQGKGRLDWLPGIKLLNRDSAMFPQATRSPNFPAITRNKGRFPLVSRSTRPPGDDHEEDHRFARRGLRLGHRHRHDRRSPAACDRRTLR
jgi:hypothetical protein